MDIITAKIPYKIQGLLIVMLLSGVTVIADYFLKRASLHASPFSNYAFIIGITIYILSAFAWVWAMPYMDLAILGACYSVTVALLLAVVGVFYFGETLRPRDFAGLVLGTGSLILLNS